MSFSTISPRNLDVWTGGFQPKMTKPKATTGVQTEFGLGDYKIGGFCPNALFALANWLLKARG